MDQLAHRIVTAAREVFGPGPLLVVGAPPATSLDLRLHGFEVEPAPLPDDAWLHGWAQSVRHRQVLLAVFDPSRAAKWNEAFGTLFDSQVDVLLHVVISAEAADVARFKLEQAAFAAGYRKHPAYYRVNSYIGLEFPTFPTMTPLVRAPGEANRELAELQLHRKLHMDMSRESGRRSDGHMFRYQLASHYLQPGDTVVDAGCGKGYGAWMLSCLGPGKSVRGIDESQSAVAYARRSFASHKGGGLGYEVGDAQELADVADNSVDLLTAFEFIEHIPDPDRFLANCSRALRPGGRLVVSVPNMWVDDSGKDPNPFHLHVYNWSRILDELGQRFRIERCFAQSAGGGFKRPESLRHIAGFSPDSAEKPDGEWCLVVAMNSPIEKRSVAFDNTRFGPVGINGWNLNSISEQYSNPWLVAAIAQGGLLRNWRMSDLPQRLRMAEQALELDASTPVDRAAMLAVLGYGALETFDTAKAGELIGTVRQCLLELTDEPVGVRWKISLHYLLARLLQLLGNRPAAAEEYRACAAIDPLAFGPAIATKTISALKELGRMQFLDSDLDGARTAWRKGVAIGRHVLTNAGWTSVVGSESEPDEVGLYEVSDAFAHAHECAMLLRRANADSSSSGAFSRLESLTKDGMLRALQAQLKATEEIAGTLQNVVLSARQVLRG